MVLQASNNQENYHFDTIEKEREKEMKNMVKYFCVALTRKNIRGKFILLKEDGEKWTLEPMRVLVVGLRHLT